MKKFIIFLFLLGCFRIEETIYISQNNYNLKYKIYMSYAITQIISEDSIKNHLKDEDAKYIKVESDSQEGITTIEMFYENLDLKKLIQKDSSLKFNEDKNYNEFLKIISLNDTLTKSLLPFLTEQDIYKVEVISQKQILQSNADSVYKNRLVWIIPLKKIYELKPNDSLKIIFRVEK